MPPKGRKAGKVTLASVLARHDEECLLSELEGLQTESEVFLSTKAETQAVCGHLQNVVTGSKAWSSIHLQLLIQLLKVLPADLTEQLAKILLDSSLLQLMSQAFDKLFRPLQEGATNQQLEHAMMVLLQSLEDLSRAQYKGPGKQGMVSGKDKCGALFVSRLVSLSVSRCVQLLLELTTRSPSNRELLFGCHPGCKQLFGHVLATCGDFCTQADMMEILYRAAKQESLKDANIAFQGMPKPKAVLEYLVAKPLQDIESVGLDLELRQLVKAYNASLGTNASVYSFKATGVSIGGSRAVRAEEGKWVDVGKQHISLTVIVPEPASGADSEDPPPDLLDIYYSNIASMDAKALPGNDSRYVQLKLSLKEVPDILLDHFGAQDKSLVVSLTFRKDDSDKLLGVIKKVAPQLVKPAASKPVHDSQDSFFELTQRPEPRVKMSMTMQTLSFRPTTTASGVTPGVQKGSLDLQPSTHRARPSGATVQQQATRPAQGGAALPTAAASAAAHSLPGIRSSSMQQSKDTRNLAVPQKQLAAEQPAYEAMAEDTAHSPVAEQQVERAPERSLGSHGSGSSSDPSEEVLDDPTNIALSQRAPAHLQRGGAMPPPHGDPLLQAAQAQLGQQPASVEEELPDKELPSKQGEWIRKQGSAQSAVPHQTGSTSAAQPNQDRSKGPAPSLRLPKQPQAQPLLDEDHCSIPAQSSRAHAATALPQAEPLPHQNRQSNPALSARAKCCHQPRGLQEEALHVRSSPLYAASEGEDSESESSAGKHAEHHQTQSAQEFESNPARPTRASRAHTSSKSTAAVDAQKPKAKKDAGVMPQPARQTRASSGQASRAVKPPTGRAQGRAKPSAPVRQVGRQKGRKHGDEDDQEGFGLLSEDEMLPVRPSKGGASKQDGTSQKSASAQQGRVKSTKSPEYLSEAANPQFQPHHRASDTADPPTKAHTRDRTQHHAASSDRAHTSKEGLNAESSELVGQATALEEAAALQDSAQDPEWLEIAQNVPDGKEMQARADEEDQEPACQDNAETAHHPQQQLHSQREPEQRNPRQRQLFQEPGSGDEAEPCHHAAPTAKQALPADQQPTRQHKGNTAKQGEAVKAQDQQAGRGRKRPEGGRMVEETLPDDDDVPSTYNNMPPRRQQQPQHDSHADQNAAPREEDFQEAMKAKKNRSQKLQGKEEVPDQVAGAELEFDASDAESDEYEPTQAKAADEDEGAKAAAKPKKGKASRLRKIALMPSAGEDEDQYAQAHGEPGDAMQFDIEDDDVQPFQPSAQQLLQPKGRANKPLPFPQARAANQQRPTGRPAALAQEDEAQAFRFPAMHEGKQGGTPAIDLPEHTWGMQRPVSAKKHARLPFPAHMPPPPPPALEAEEEAEEDIEVDLGLQQALIQSIAPSPAKMHTKGHALHDISNWRLPTPAKKQGAGAGVSPLQALTGPKGNKQQQPKPMGDAFEVFQDQTQGKKAGGTRAKGAAAAGLPGTALFKPTKPKAARGKVAKPQSTVHEASDSEEEEGAGTGPSLKGVLQHMIQQGVNTQDGDSDDEGSGMADLQRMLQKVVSSKKASARQKQAELIKGVQNHVNGLCAEMSKSLKKELQESAALCQAQFEELCNQLADRKAQITAKTEMYQQEVQGLWEGYKETYAKLEPMRQGLAMYMQEKSAGHKRKLADIQSEGERLMSDVERKLARTQSKAAKLPALAKMLKAFV